TPDYVNSTQQNRYTELSAVASSTLSSQLNNLLGQISDNWNIGTNIRSDKGDFKDVEVELALSSQLLNNRLLFNGNFGYRDNPNANNSFIGDFDLEYLINPSGSWRLKAYNHYNDRNYSVKSALTTQGVGILFKKDFNTFSDLFNLFLQKKKRTNE
ncbi:MAG: translocation/assembly module TamB domain-containing protein, partial [Bacteroidales bacterium]